MIQKFRAWDKRDKEVYLAEIIGNIYENPEYDQNFVRFRIKEE